jgi:hypothetical protein
MGGEWPLLPLAPAVVLLLGIAVALAIGTVGLSNLATESDDHAAARADLLAATMAARIAPLSMDERLEIMQGAARKTGAELMVVTREGDVVLDASLGQTSKAELGGVVARHAGQAMTGLGRARFAVTALPAPASPNGYLVAFVREPSTPEVGPSLLRALVALTTLLVGVAAAVAYAVARDANKDVDFVALRVRGMIHVRSEPAGEAVPVRAMDEVGALTARLSERPRARARSRSRPRRVSCGCKP